MTDNIIVIGSRELVWDSLAEDGYVVEHLLKNGYSADDTPNVKCVFVDDKDHTAMRDEVNQFVRDFLNDGIPATIYVVDDLAITYAMLLSIMAGKMLDAGLCDHVYCFGSDGDFRDLLETVKGICNDHRY
jgi:hypothetical protein